MIALVSNLLLLAAIIFALVYGGRYERYAGLMFLAAMAASNIAQRLTATLTPMGAYLAIDLALLATLTWLARRTGRLWVVLAVGLQAGIVALDCLRMAGADMPLMLYFRLIYAIAFIQIACLVFAVLRRSLGPPHSPPGARDPDA